MIILPDKVFHLTNSPDKVAAILNHVIKSADPYQVVDRSFQFSNNSLVFTDKTLLLDRFERIIVFGIGKASIEMSRAIVEKMEEKIDKVLVVTKTTPDTIPEILQKNNVKILVGDHPIPGQRSLLAGRMVKKIIANLTAKDLLVCLISGGGSSMIVAPVEGISLGDVQKITKALLRCGASIQEINTIRKHLDELKGGGLARLAFPAKIVSLIISDVVGNQIDVIASGMTTYDSTTYSDAKRIIEKYRIDSEVDNAIMEKLNQGIEGKIAETLKSDDPIIQNLDNRILLTNLELQKAAMNAAIKEGFNVQQLSKPTQGLASKVGEKTCMKFLQLIKKYPRPFLFVGGGETTVEVRGKGIGGRNLEMALSAVALLENIPNVAMITFTTDGEDGSTDSAGAIVTGETMSKARKLKYLPEQFLENNDSYTFFRKVGGLITIGSTRTNVNDLVFFFAF
jgi:glycerate 2-kinase